MEELAPGVRDCPVPVVFDHLGWPNPNDGPDQTGVRLLRALLSDGAAWVKLSAPYRMCHAPYTTADEITAALADANPDRCLWGSDWPHLMLADAEMPDAGRLFDSFCRSVPDPEVRKRILVDTPTALYGFA
jgi:predicted TIM-barrel fold metal-dependent hydrolase